MKQYELVPHPVYGFLQIQPTPTPEEIRSYYLNEFYSNNLNFNDSSLEVQTKDKDWYDFCRGRVLSNIENILQLEAVTGKTLLDIGCGWGEALLFFRSKGLDCYGFDPASDAIAYGKQRGLNIVEAGLDTMNVFSHTFDIVTLFNVLEHLSDPVRILQEIYETVLKPGGILVIDVPNEFNVFQVAGRDTHNLPDWWVAPPAHLNYFNPKTLRALAEGIGYDVRLIESSFPIEIFLLFGDNYVGNLELGRRCHEKRMNFEINLAKAGKKDFLGRFYKALADIGVGRQITLYAVKPV